jgi:Tfp pilus assembly protein PilN
MIKINLLPPELTKSKRSRGGKVVRAPSSASAFIIPFIVVVYLGVGLFAYSVYNHKKKDDKDVTDLLNESEELKNKVEARQEEFHELMDLKSTLENQIEILEALNPPNRLMWAEKINMIADIIPKGVYITNINVTEYVRQIETNASRENRKTWVKAGSLPENKPSVINKPEITQHLSISGITWADDPEQRLQLIMRFYEAMKLYENRGFNGKIRRFMDNFQEIIRIDPTYEAEVSKRTVNRFKLILKTIPFSTKE